MLRKRLEGSMGTMEHRDDRAGTDLFGTLAALGEDLLAAARLLQDALVAPSPSRMSENLRHIRSLEEASNATIRDVVRGLEGDPGPLSALQVSTLLRYLDEAMDAVEEAAGFVQAYAVQQRTKQAVKLASFVVRAAQELLGCIEGLRDRAVDVSARVRAVAETENEADELYRAALGSLMVFVEDPFHAMCWKEIYDRLERATNRCEEAAQFMGSLVAEDGRASWERDT